MDVMEAELTIRFSVYSALGTLYLIGRLMFHESLMYLDFLKNQSINNQSKIKTNHYSLDSSPGSHYFLCSLLDFLPDCHRCYLFVNR